MSNYPTNLTEKQWQVIKNIVEPQERNIKNSLREILNGIFWDCQWPSRYMKPISMTAKGQNQP